MFRNLNLSSYVLGFLLIFQVACNDSPAGNSASSAVSGGSSGGNFTGTVNAFGPFKGVGGAALSTNFVSDTLTLSGGFSNATATCNAGCTGISINGGTFVAGPITGVNSGDTIAIEQTSSSSNNATTSVTVTVGNTTSSAWLVTTLSSGTVNTFVYSI